MIASKCDPASGSESGSSGEEGEREGDTKDGTGLTISNIFSIFDLLTTSSKVLRLALFTPDPSCVTAESLDDPESLLAKEPKVG